MGLLRFPPSTTAPLHSNLFSSALISNEKVLGCRIIYTWISCAFNGVGQRLQYQTSSVIEDWSCAIPKHSGVPFAHQATCTNYSMEQVDPFSLVAGELSILANRLQSMVVAEVPKLASAPGYFFKMGVEGKRFRPMVLLLIATALNLPVYTSFGEDCQYVINRYTGKTAIHS